MNNEQIIKDIDIVLGILNADSSPARRSAAAVLLRAAADAIEAQSEPQLRPLESGEEIEAGDIYRAINGKLFPSGSLGRKYDPAHYLPHFRPINH